MCAGLVPTFPVCWEPVEPAWSPPATEAECHPGDAHGGNVRPPQTRGDITGRPGIFPPEAGNVTLTVLLSVGPTVRPAGIFPRPSGTLPAGGNITGAWGHPRPAGIFPAFGGGIPAFPAGAGIFRLARGYSRQGGWISRGACPAVKWVLTRLTTVGSNVAKRHAESKQQTRYNNCCFS